MLEYFKIGNVLCCVVSDTSFFMCKSVSLPYPWRVLVASMPYLGIIDFILDYMVDGFDLNYI